MLESIQLISYPSCLRNMHLEIAKWALTWGFFALKYAADAACTVLRVDQIIMAKPAGGQTRRDQPEGMVEDQVFCSMIDCLSLVSLERKILLVFENFMIGGDDLCF
ncbi:uncharacterized protein LOC111277246 [Durio zibethinus]|uniref:Uncharacterized protein LOC111277246 n=1 Tax=Durio zibethinus TaxID=66656 RepID=A0A6P5WT27_DURZI|nr:uncharacterized protein LOC111277246 [Durio zibethinus]XP_022719285.1 uncharacterized protein LOC111277246 [Durio zibethinus]